MAEGGRILRIKIGKKKTFNCLEQTDNRNMDIKVSASESSEGSKEHYRDILNCLRENLNEL